MERKSSDEPWIDPDDAPELTDAHFDRADWYIGEELIRRGRPEGSEPQEEVVLRIDGDVLAALRALGPGWKMRASEALRAFVEQQAIAAK